jgi:PAS domain-containing protein
MAGDLARRLRTLFPRVVVRASEVSGQEDVWYVYRDGVWRSSADPRWWTDERMPTVSVTLDGWVEEANAPARALLGLAATDPLPRHFTDFVAPGTLADATDLFTLVAAGHELSATTLLRPTSGEVIACDLRAWLDGGRILGAFRLADDIPVQVGVQAVAAPPLRCMPATDALFARYAADVVAQMPEPTPEGLELRLRRLYPHARVEATDESWAVFRDSAGEGDTSGWWRAEGLPTVRYDGQGLILAANEAAHDLLGTELVGRHWQDLVTPGTTDQVASVLRLIAEQGWAVSRFRMPRPDGYLFEFDSYTEVIGDQFLTIMRPAVAEEPGAA